MKHKKQSVIVIMWLPGRPGENTMPVNRNTISCHIVYSVFNDPLFRVALILYGRRQPRYVL